MNIVMRRTLLAATIVLATAVGTAAQGTSPAAMERLKAERLWLNSQNAAGTVFDDISNFSTLQLSYDMLDGDYHHPHDGKENSDIGIGAEGFVDLKNLYVWGEFGFVQRSVQQAGYNASITNPLRGMPYYVIDNHLSDWDNQYYDMAFRVATPSIGGRWSFGLDGAYQASIATKQRDPRVDTRFYSLKIVPGVAFAINKSNRIGLSLLYESVKEDSRMENEDSYTDQDYYILYGLGTAVKYIGDGRETNYFGDRVGAALQYGLNHNNWNLLFEGAYNVKVENVEQSFTTPKKDAAVKDHIWDFSLNTYHKGIGHTHQLGARFIYRHIDGIQYVSQRDNSESQQGWIEVFKSIRSTYATQQASLDYTFMTNRGNEYDWMVQIGVDYLNRKDEYLLPYSVKSYENLSTRLTLKKNIALGSKMNNRLLADVHGLFNNNLCGRYHYGGSHADYISVTAVEQGDFRYMASDYWHYGLKIVYSQAIKSDDRMNIYVGAGFDRISACSHDFSHRNLLSITAGCNF